MIIIESYKLNNYRNKELECILTFINLIIAFFNLDVIETNAISQKCVDVYSLILKLKDSFYKTINK